MTMPAKYIWIDGALRDISENHSSLLAHGLHYGTGVFEGIRCYETPTGPAIFRLDAHLARMQAGAEVLGMHLDLSAMKAAVSEVLSANKHRDAYVRPIAFYGAGSLGLDVGPELTHHVVVASMSRRQTASAPPSQTGCPPAASRHWGTQDASSHDRSALGPPQASRSSARCRPSVQKSWGQESAPRR